MSSEKLYTMGSPDEALRKEFERRTSYYNPKNARDPNKVSMLHEKARQVIYEAGEDMIAIVPGGRELSLVLTKLEEAMFWANAGIARHYGSEGGRS